MSVQKKGIDYFPLAAEFDDNIELIIAEFGMTGLGILIKLWQKIYNSEGYYCEWNEDVALMFSRKCGEGVNVVSEVIKGCFRRSIFDKSLFDKYSILTSEGIQKRYLEACKRRNSVNLISEYLLIGVSKISSNVNISRLNADISAKNEYILPQSKVKEKKVKESKVKKRDNGEIPTLEEVEAYCRKRKNKINAERFFNYYSARMWRINGEPMDWKAAVRSWENNGINDAKQSAGTISRNPTYDLNAFKSRINIRDDSEKLFKTLQSISVEEDNIE